MARTAGTKKTKATSEKEPKKTSSFFDYLRFGESYTSLILGIIVVIIATALLLSFVHNKNAGNKNTPINQQTQNTAEVSQQAQELSTKAPNTIVDTSGTVTPTVTLAPTVVPTSIPTPTAKPTPTTKPQPTAAPKPTAKPRVVAKPKHKVVIEKKIAVVHKASKPTKQNNNNVWIVQKNESLWVIAQEKYSSGYNWVDIARANNLSNPSDIHVGDRLVLPNVPTKTPTIVTATPVPTATPTPSVVHNTGSGAMSKITGNTYTVTHGDNLWNIAVRAYGDGYKWVDIARANGLSNPGTIFSGNVLTIPR